MRYKAAKFDMDGTILNTLDDDENQFIERLKEAVGEAKPAEFARKTGITEDDAGLK